MVGVVGFEPSNHEGTDLQSVYFSHLYIYPKSLLQYFFTHNNTTCKKISRYLIHQSKASLITLWEGLQYAQSLTAL